MPVSTLTAILVRHRLDRTGMRRTADRGGSFAAIRRPHRR